MAIIPSTLYPANTNAPDANYPLGSARNVVVSGDGTGTPYEQALLNDLWGLLQKLLSAAGIAASGTPDTILASQYFQALENLFLKKDYIQVDGEDNTLLDNNGTALDATAIFIGDGTSTGRATYARVAIIGRGAGGNKTGELYFTNRGTDTFNSFGSGIRGVWTGNDARNNDLVFFVSNITNETLEVGRFASYGALGIGTTQPFLGENTSSITGIHIKSPLNQPQVRVESTVTTGYRAAILRAKIDSVDFGFFCDSDGLAYIRTYTNHPITIGINSLEAARFDTARNFLVGKTATNTNTTGAEIHNTGFTSVTRDSDVALHVQRRTTTGTLVDLYYNGAVVGTISTNGTTTAYNTTSDYRLKENITPITNALDKLHLLKPSRFNFIADIDKKETDGFIAHELQNVIPEAVTGVKDETKIDQVIVKEKVDATYDENGEIITPEQPAEYEAQEVPVYQAVDHSKIVPLLVAAIQELSKEVQELKNMIK